MKGAQVRAQAARLLAGVIYDGKSLNQVLPAAITNVSPPDRALFQELCYGTLRFSPRLEAQLTQLLSKPFKRKDGDIHALLLLGLYQLHAMRVPAHAAVNTTVSATAALKKPWAKKLCNAVLRRYLREADQLSDSLSEAERAAHSAWLYDALGAQWPDDRNAVIEANNHRPPLTLRVNTSRIAREQAIAQLSEAGIDCVAGEISPQAIYLREALDVNAIPGFAEGLFSVQDESTQLAAPLLNPQPGEHILDACAAPGGKTCHVLEYQPSIAQLLAVDASEERLIRIQENLSRLDMNADLLCADAREPHAMLPAEHFDRILLDAPCSATGVIRRHPDIKALRQADDIANFATTQQQLLAGVWPALKPGGTVLYVTCSVLDAENDDTIAAWLAHGNDARVEPIEATWGQATRYGRQVLPNVNAGDGLYYCRLRKVPA